MTEDNKQNVTSFPELMTEQELILYLRLPEISKTENYSNVVENLKRMHDLPCIHISKQPLYPVEAVREWIDKKLQKENGR